MLFCFWLEKFKDFVRDFLVQRQRIEIRAGRRSDNGLLDFFRSKLFTGFRLGKIQRWRFRWKRKAITVLENSDVIDIFLTRVADFQKICFQQRNSVREELRQWPMQIAAQGRVQRILKNMREFPGNFRKSRKPIACRRSTQRMRRNVESFEIFPPRFNVLEHADVFPQILQVLRGLLEEHLDGFAVQRTHARPSATSSGFCNSSAVGFR